MMTDEEFEQKAIKQAEKIILFSMGLKEESDRGSVLMSAAFLDEYLSSLLKANFIDDEKTFTDLCNGTGGLATFSAKIELCYLLGLISLETRRDLNIIRRIRNEFAHSMETISFETESVANRCRSLNGNYFRDIPATARNYFSSASFGIARLLSRKQYSSKKPEVLNDYSNGNRYNR